MLSFKARSEIYSHLIHKVEGQRKVRMGLIEGGVYNLEKVLENLFILDIIILADLQFFLDILEGKYDEYLNSKELHDL